MNRSRVAGWQHCVIQSGDIVDNRWLLRNKCNRTGTGGRCCLFHVCSIVASKQSKAATGGTGQDDIFWPLYFHGAHNAPVAAALVMACMHAYNIGQALIVLSTAMIRNSKIRMKEESFRQSTILYEREEVFVDCWIVTARE
jgi:hypothetical protein